MSKVLIIAEAGVNHNGSIEVAKQLIDAASVAGVDYVKFQSFKADELVGKDAKKAEYQSRNMGNPEDDSQYTMLKKLELSEEEHLELIEYCRVKGVKFFSTAFDLKSVALLHSLDLGLWKVPSGELTNLPYLRAIAKYKEPIIVSTGMATLEEISQSIDILLAEGVTREQITLLHCTTEYPAPIDQVNLKAMTTLKEHFGMEVGYSDHTEGITIPIAATAMGATVIEKHFTLDKQMEGPDHRASLEPDELISMCNTIRELESALGDGEKEPCEAEKKNIAIARKSIVAIEDIAAGETLSDTNIGVKRPGNGISPMRWDEVIGSTALRAYKEGELIEF